MKSILFALLFAAAQVSLATAPSTGEQARVLVVHSYGSQHVCGRPQGDGVAAALAERGWHQGKNLEIRSVFMDTKKVYTTPEAIRERAQLALQTVDEFRPHVLVVLDDNAIREVMLTRQPSREFATVEQIGGTAAFLCSDAAAQITGTTLSVDGGWTAM